MARFGRTPIVFGSTDADQLQGGEAAEILNADAGDDLLAGGAGNDTLVGGSGSDTLQGDAGADVLYGGSGDDLLIYDFDAETGETLERLYGGDGADTLLMNFSADSFTPEIQAEVSAYALAVANGGDPGLGGVFVFSTIPLHAANIQSVVILVDGEEQDPNRPPNGVARDDAFTVEENQTLEGDVSENDGFRPGDVVTLVEGVDRGELSLNDDGSFTFEDPEGEFDFLSVGDEAEVSFTYSLQTGNEPPTTATATITITGVNDEPTGGAIFEIANEDVPLTGNLLIDGGADDIDQNDVLAITEVAGVAIAAGGQETIVLPSGATITVSSNGDYSYDASTGFNDLSVGDVGADEFTYTVADGEGGEAGGFASLTIEGENDAPDAGAITETIGENATLADNILALSGATDPDRNDVLRIQSVNGQTFDQNGQIDLTLVSGARLIVSANGDFTYDTQTAFDELADGDLASDDFDYTVVDDQGAEAGGSASLTILGENDAPDGGFLAANVSEDEVATFDLFADAGVSDPDVGDVLTFVAVDGVEFNGANEITITTTGGADLTVTADGQVTYDPRVAFNDLSADDLSFDDFTYAVEDDSGARADGFASLTIEGANDAPDAGAISAAIGENEALNGNIFDLSGAIDPDFSDTLRVVAINGQALDAGSLTLTLESGVELTVDEDGAFTYANIDQFDALSPSETALDGFTYAIADDLGETATGTAEIAILGENDAPEAGALAATISENETLAGDLLLDTGAFDVDNEDSLRIAAVNGEAIGDAGEITLTLASGVILTVSETGAFTYETGEAFDALAVGETALDAFSYTVADSFGGESVGLAEVTINGENDAPVVIVPVALTVLEDDGPIQDAVIFGSDVVDPDANDTLSIVSAGGVEIENAVTFETPAGAIVTFNADGSFTYDPNGAFETLSVGDTASEEVAYTVSDGNGGTVDGVVSVSIEGENDDPDPGLLDEVLGENDVIGGNFLLDGGAFDIDVNDVLSIAAINGQTIDPGGEITLFTDAGARLTVASDGAYTYDTDFQFDFLRDLEEFFDDVTYTVSDGQGGDVDGLASFTIIGENDAPEAEEIFIEVSEDDEPISIDLLETAFDIEDDDLTADFFSQLEGRDVFARFGFAAYRFENGPFTDGTMGGAPTAVGDIDGDGTQDFVIGLDETGAGAARLYFGGRDELDLADQQDGSFDGEVDLSLTPTRSINISGEATGDMLSAFGEAGDLNGDGVDDLLIGAPGAGAGGEVYVVFGGAAAVAALGGDFDPSDIVSGVGYRIGGAEAGDDLGFYLARQPAGDVTGDGVADLVVSARGAAVGSAPDVGVVYVLSGASLDAMADADGFIDIGDVTTFGGYRIEGDFNNGRFGESLSFGDVNGDGVSDILFGAPGSESVTEEPDTGEAVVVFGGAALEAADNRFSVDDNVFRTGVVDGATGYKFLGDAAGDAIGLSVAVIGDVNGDGVADLLIGSTETDTGATGEAYLVFGGADNLAAFDAADGFSNGRIFVQNVTDGFGYRIEGAQPFEQLGTWTIDAGDYDGDGVADFAIGGVGNDPNGSVGPVGTAYLFSGAQLEALDVAGGDADDNVIEVADLDGVTGFAFTEEQPNSGFGAEIDLADVNGDGIVDLLIGATGFDVPNDIDPSGDFVDAGASYLFIGGQDRFAALDGDNDGVISAAGALGRFTDVSRGAEGAFGFDAFDPAAFQDLADGDVEDIVIEYEISDGIDFVVNTITISVTGENDAPEGEVPFITTDEDTEITVNVIEDGPIFDVDAGAVISVAAADGEQLQNGLAFVALNSGATAIVDAAGGVEFDPRGFYDFLAVGETEIESFEIELSDDFGASILRTVEIEITGVNDAPVGADIAVAGTEDDTVAGSLEDLSGVFDPEGFDVALVSLNGEGVTIGIDQPSSFFAILDSGASVFSSIDGQFTYDPRDAFQFLGDGETATDAFTFTYEDDVGAQTTFTAEVTIAGSNDPAAFQGTGPTQVSLISISADGAASGDLPSITPQIATDGASVVFTSNARNLVEPDDNDALSDVLLADIDNGGIERINLVNGDAQQGDGGAVSSDGLAAGRFVVFETRSNILNAADLNENIDVYVRDRDTGATELISGGLGGEAADGDSTRGSISADGRFVAFQTTSTNVAAGDANGAAATVALHDRLLGTSIDVSSSRIGAGDELAAINPKISGDGSTVVFATANALDAADENGVVDIYAYDVETDSHELISIGTGGDIADAASFDVSVSANGRYVYFSSDATNLVADDTNGVRDGFVHDRQTGETTRINVSSSGQQSSAPIGDGSNFGEISADGRFVTFATEALDLDAQRFDTNFITDVYLHDRLTSETARISVQPDGDGQPGGFTPSISADGSRIAFASLDERDPFDPRGDDDFADVYVADVDINGVAFDTNDGTVTIDLLKAYVDPEGDDLDIGEVRVTTDKGREVEFSVDAEAGTIRLDAAQFEDNDAGDFELISITYSISDESGDTIEATAGASVLRIDDGVALDAIDDAFATDEDTVLVESVDANDITGSGAIFTLLDGPALGDLAFFDDGGFTFDPRADFNDLDAGETAEASFTYQAELGGQTDTATVVVTIDGVDDPGAGAPSQVQAIDLVTFNLDGDDGGNGQSLAPEIDGDGRTIVFQSAASDIFAQTNNATNAYFVDLLDPTIRPLNTQIGGQLTQTAGAVGPDVSGDGQFAVFESAATDISENATDGLTNVFLKDLSTGDVELISIVQGRGQQGQPGPSVDAVVSGNGRFVAFSSESSILAEEDENGAVSDVFIVDRLTGETRVASQPAGADVANFDEASILASISDDGSTLVFLTGNALAGEDENRTVPDLYAFDVATGGISLVTAGAAGGAADQNFSLAESDPEVNRASISDNGRYVAFASTATNLVEGDVNGVADVFVRDLATGTTEIVSIATSGAFGDGASVSAAISGDGRFVSFQSSATNLDEARADTNGVDDVFLHDRVTGETIRVSVDPLVESQPGGAQPTISDDGSKVAFVSDTVAEGFSAAVTTGEVNDVYVADIATTGFSFTEDQGTAIVDLAKDFIDPEGDTVFEIVNFSYSSDTLFPEDAQNPNGTEFLITPDMIDAGAMFTTATIDTSRMQGLGVDEYEIVSVDFDVVQATGNVAHTVAFVIEGRNDNPFGDAESYVVNAGETFAGTFVASDRDRNDTLTVEQIPSAFPGVLAIDQVGASLEADLTDIEFPFEFGFTVDIDAGASGTITTDLLVSDDNGGSSTFQLTFDVNGAPVFAPINDLQVAIIDEAFTLDVGAFFTDPEEQALSYTASFTGLSGSGELPRALDIDAATGVITGVPSGVDPGLHRVAVTATDELGLATTGEFWLAVAHSVIAGTADGDRIDDTTIDAVDLALNNVIIGGEGNDLINGDNGLDVYVYNRGDGFDSLADNGGGDIDVVLMQDIASDEVTFRRGAPDTEDLIVELTSAAGAFTDGFSFDEGLDSSGSRRLDGVAFSDGVILTREDIVARITADQVAGQARLIEGGDFAETLAGTDGATLIGRRGSDIYIYEPGDGAVTIHDDAVGGGDLDTIQIGFNLLDPNTGDIAPEIRQIPGTLDLVIDFGNGDVLTVLNTLSTTAADNIESFAFLDGAIDLPAMRQLVIDQRVTDGDDVVNGFSNSGFNDRLEGGLGDDFLSGGRGSDTYVYNAGDGDDTVRDGFTGDQDRIEVNGFDLLLDAEGFIAPGSQVTIRPGGTESDGFGSRINDFVIELNGFNAAGPVSGSIRVENQFLGSGPQIVETFVFTGPNGGPVTLTAADIREQLLFQATTDGDDVINGFATTDDDVLVGGRGDDRLNGDEQNDLYIYRAGDGNDTIRDGGFGDDDAVRVEGFDLIIDAEGVVQPGSEVTFSRIPGSEGDLLITLDNGDEAGSIQIEGHLNFASVGVIEDFVFVGDNGEVAYTFEQTYNQIVFGQQTDGDDVVISRQGQFANTIATGRGDDYAQGGSGGDTYQYVAGDGHLQIFDAGGSGTDVLDIAGYTFSQLRFDIFGDLLFGLNTDLTTNLKITPTFPVSPTDQIVVIEGVNRSIGGNIEIYRDAMGEERTADEVVQLAIDQAIASGEDIVVGSSRADVFDSNPFVDQKQLGGAGADTYTFSAGDGFTEVIETFTSGADRVILEGFSRADIGDQPGDIRLFTNPGQNNDVRIEFPTGDVLFLRNINFIEFVEFTGDGVTLSRTEFADLVADEASVATGVLGDGFFQFTSTAADEFYDGGTAGDDPATDPVENAPDQLFFTAGAIGHDYVDAGTGSSQVSLFIDVGAGGQVRFERDLVDNGNPNNLVIIVAQPGQFSRAQMETITVENWRQSVPTNLESVTVAIDGFSTRMSIDDISQAIVDGETTDGDDAILGFSETLGVVGARGNEVFEGGAGDDVIRGQGGRDDGDPALVSTQDIYRFTVGDDGVGGDGRDILDDAGFGDSDRLELISGGVTNGLGSADLANAAFRRALDDENDIIIDFGDDEVRIENLTRNLITSGFDEIVFDAGGFNEQVLSTEDVIERYVAGQVTAGDDSVKGSNFLDILEGGAGNDLLQGFGGVDVGQNTPADLVDDDPATAEIDERNYDLYKFDVGAGGAGGGGRDRIFDDAFSDLDVIEISSAAGTTSAAFANAVLRVDPIDVNSLIIDFGEDELIIQDVLRFGIAERYQRITFDAGGAEERSFSDVELVQEYLIQAATAGDDFIIGPNANAAQFGGPIELAGGGGDDFIQARGLNATFIVNPNEGDDRILDLTSGSGSASTLRINANFADVSVARDKFQSAELVIAFDAGGSVTVQNAFDGAGARRPVETYEFNDVSFTSDEITALATAQELAAGRLSIVSDGIDDIDRDIDTNGDGAPDVSVGALRGTARDEFFNGRGGADTYIYEVGAGGDDVIGETNSSQGDQLIINGARLDQVEFGRIDGADADLLITFANAEGSIRILNGIDVNTNGNIEAIVLNGTDPQTGAETVETLDIAAIRTKVHADAVTPFDDVLIGVPTNNADRFTNVAEPGTAGGRDAFFGGQGDDVYTFVDAAGVAQQMIVEDNGGGVDQIEVTGYDAAAIAVSRLAIESDDILLRLGGAGEDQILVRGGGGADTRDQIESFIFNGDEFALSEILAAADGDGSLIGGGGGAAPFSLAFSPPAPFALAAPLAAPAPPPVEPDADATVRGGGGADTLMGGSGADMIYGGNGSDALYGGAADDMLNGGAGGDSLMAGAGDDAVIGAGGGDSLYGGDGADTVDGGNGADSLYGGAGGDSLSGGARGDVVSGGDGDDWLGGAGGADSMMGDAGDDTLEGGSGADTLEGGAGDDLLTGATWDDALFGGDGADSLFGGRGADDLSGGAGDDVLDGGAQNDLLIGGEGADAFVFIRGSGRDEVLDFEIGVDRFDYSGHSVVQAFSDLLIETRDGAAFITDGLGGEVRLEGVDGAALSAGDFIF